MSCDMLRTSLQVGLPLTEGVSQAAISRPASRVRARLYSVSRGTRQSHQAASEVKGWAGRCVSLDMRR